MPTFTISRFCISALLAAAGLAMSVTHASAASQCKGLLENACLADGDCTWVTSYTRKDGRTVSSHCKLKSGRKGEQRASAASPKLSSSR